MTKRHVHKQELFRLPLATLQNSENRLEEVNPNGQTVNVLYCVFSTVLLKEDYPEYDEFTQTFDTHNDELVVWGHNGVARK